MLKLHNAYRCMHNAPMLVWNSKLATEAKAWADLNKDDPKHSPSNDAFGENIALAFTTDTQTASVEAALRNGDWISGSHAGVAGWYDEIWNTHEGPDYATPKYATRYYDDEDFEPPKGWDHYTQVVWKNTREVGCGIWCGDSTSTKRVHDGLMSGCQLVCRYSPPGNMPCPSDADNCPQYKQNLDKPNGKTYAACAHLMSSDMLTMSNETVV